MYTSTVGMEPIGLVGCTVGAPFAVLVAEQMFACGCQLLISITSAGQIVSDGVPPYFVVIDRALRDEGTSYHYAPPSRFAAADRALVAMTATALGRAGLPVRVGASWTTDAPFRETAAAVELAKAENILAVEMEVAALYTFATVRGMAVICLAHVTNTMGQVDGDFEKGKAQGMEEALRIVRAVSEDYLLRTRRFEP